MVLILAAMIVPVISVVPVTPVMPVHTVHARLLFSDTVYASLVLHRSVTIHPVAIVER
jgi:hypothetical protein